MKKLGMIHQGYCERSCLVDLLSHDFLFTPFDYQVKNGKVETEVDAAFWAGTENPDFNDVSFLKELGVKQIGMPRVSKLEEHMVMSRLGIPCPEYYNANTGYSFQAVSLLDGIDDDVPLVVKSFFGARGLQQFLIRRGALVRSVYPGADGIAGKKQGRFLNGTEAKNSGLSIFKSRDCKESGEDVCQGTDAACSSVVLGGGEDENGESKDFFEGKELKSWLITKKVQVQHEYRVIAFRGAGLMWCERHVNLCHFQNNLTVGTEVSYLGEDFDVSVPEAVKTSTHKFAADLQAEYPSAPFFSMDVYLSDSGEVGMFEYSGEFGFAAMDFDELRKRAATAINGML